MARIAAVALALLLVALPHPAPATAERWREWREAVANGDAGFAFPIFAWSYFVHPGFGDEDEDFRRYAQAGFTLVQVPPRPAMIDRARDAGLAVILGTWQRADDHPERVAVLAGESRRSPAVSAFLLRDEPGRDRLAALGAAYRRLFARDAGKAIALVTVLPSHASTPRDPQRFDPAAPCGAPRSYCDFLDETVALAHPSVLLATHYPFWEGGERPTYYEDLEDVRARSGAHGIGMFGFVQVTPHLDGWAKRRYRRPSPADLSRQVYGLVAYGAKGIAYYNYRVKPADMSNPKLGMGEGIVTARDGLPTESFAPVQRLNCELRALGPRLMGVESVSVAHADRERPAGTRAPGTAAGAIAAEVSPGPLVVGALRGPGADAAGSLLVLVSKTREGAPPLDVRLRLAHAGAAVRRLRVDDACTVEPQTQPLRDGWLEVTLAPGEGAVFSVDRAP